MSTSTHASNAEAEQTGIKEVRREARFLNPKMLKGALKLIIAGLNLWRFAAKLWEWFL